MSGTILSLGTASAVCLHGARGDVEQGPLVIASAVCGKKKREKPKTLNGRLPLEDSSVFDDSVLVFIVMT